MPSGLIDPLHFQASANLLSLLFALLVSTREPPLDRDCPEALFPRLPCGADALLITVSGFIKACYLQSQHVAKLACQERSGTEGHPKVGS
jgi:hypothetical protein